MNQRTGELNEANGTIAHDIQTVVAAGKDGLEPAVHPSGADDATVGKNLHEKLSSAKASLSDAARPALDEATRAARAADGYVRSKPWAVIGIAAAVGAFVGFFTGKR
jgi:ElaB/YqjD/DUF883 family membrane-anchored ribosome-binding protein